MKKPIALTLLILGLAAAIGVLAQAPAQTDDARMLAILSPVLNRSMEQRRSVAFHLQNKRIQGVVVRTIGSTAVELRDANVEGAGTADRVIVRIASIEAISFEGSTFPH